MSFLGGRVVEEERLVGGRRGGIRVAVGGVGRAGDGDGEARVKDPGEGVAEAQRDPDAVRGARLDEPEELGLELLQGEGHADDALFDNHGDDDAAEEARAALRRWL